MKYLLTFEIGTDRIMKVKNINYQGGVKMEEKDKEMKGKETSKVSEKVESKKKEPAKKEASKVATKKTEGTTKADTKKTIETNTEKKKVDNKAKFEPVKKVENKKKHTGLKFILILVVIAIVLFLVHYLRNYIIVSKIFNERAKYKDVTNYSYYQTSNDENRVNGVQFYKKGNTMMMVIKDKKCVIWSNKELNQTILLNYEEMKATITSGVSMPNSFDSTPSDNATAVLGELENAQTSRGFSFVYAITSENVNGVDCYKVCIGQEKAWYSKENGMLIKYINGSLDEDYSDWKFNELTDEDVARPNLLGFTIENKTNN